MHNKDSQHSVQHMYLSSTYRGWELKGSLVSLDFAPGPSFTAEPSLEANLNKNKKTTKLTLNDPGVGGKIFYLVCNVMWGGGGGVCTTKI